MFSLAQWLRRRSVLREVRLAAPTLEQIRTRQPHIGDLGSVRERARNGEPLDSLLVDAFAAVAEASERVLGLRPFDVQLLAGLAMHQGRIAEMQTGEGKTLAAVFPAFLNALTGQGVHVLTVNDYLARRDAEWMGGVYRLLGLSVAHVAQDMALDDRRGAYDADVTYATANEIGFDLLRDHLRHDPADLVQGDFNFALIDEADSILIDEARIPLVIAGATSASQHLPHRMTVLARQLQPGSHYTSDEYARNVNLTAHGARRAETALRCGNLYDPENLALLTALNHAIHAQELLRRDVDYVVKNGQIEMVDEFKGRIATNRRWPDGLQAALEAKEGVALQREGRVLASITLQNLIGLYPKVAGMTATAYTQAEELRRVYGLEVAVIPPNRPNIRADYADVIFTHRAAKEVALMAEIRAVHGTGRPILVGTASVAESERLGRTLAAAGIPNRILNARNDGEEAQIIAQAGALGAVTISTNMAGRGTDILLGGNPPVDRDKVVALGGLYVIGTNKHESRRIDNQLRGRAGRQGDPGSSMFLISLEDDLIQRFGIMTLLPLHYRRFRSADPIDDPAVAIEVDRAQRIIESQNLDIRQRLWRYEGVLEQQRRIVHERRRAALLGSAGLLAERAEERFAELAAQFGQPLMDRVERVITLAKIDEFWSDYLEHVTGLREGIHWVTLAGHDPVHEFRKSAIEIFDQLLIDLDDAIVETFVAAEITMNGINPCDADLLDTSSTWTYLTNDQPMGDLAQRLFKGFAASWRLRQRQNSNRA